MIRGAAADGGRLTSGALALWLRQRRDNDLQVIIHGLNVPIGSAEYDPIADAIVLRPVDGEDLRIACADCPKGDE